jgi:hypothetical protein
MEYSEKDQQTILVRIWLIPIVILFSCCFEVAAQSRLSPPEFSHQSGFYDLEFSLILSSDIEGVEIYYTLDGSQPHPDHLGGSTYQYKNQWREKPEDLDGELLTGIYRTYKYQSPINIFSRSSQTDILTNIASSFENPPNYFPANPVFKGTVVRAMTWKEGHEASSIVTNTFFHHDRMRERFNLPVISISTCPSNLFDYERGIYTPGMVFDDWRDQFPDDRASGSSPANYNRRGIEWEHPASFTFWDTSSVFPDLNQDIGLRIHGGWSRRMPMKSLRIYARNEYGTSTLAHKFFPEQRDDEYKRLILRNSGDDRTQTLYRDALIQRICRELNFDTQAYRPAVLFLNGEYWGIHNIRERYDKHYIKRVYNVEEGELDFLTLRNTVIEGDNKHYNETLKYIEENNLREDENYLYIKTRIDTKNFIDYKIANIYVNNTDWPGGNINFWRKRTESFQPHSPNGHDGRWRWLALDMEYGFGIWGRTAAENDLESATLAGGTAWPNPDWSTFLLRNFLKNESFKADFINRFADLLNTSFLPERVLSLLEKYKQVLEPEFPEHIERWRRPNSMKSWNTAVSQMRDFIIQRPGYQWGHLMDYFGLDTVSVIVSVSSVENGFIRINDIDINPSTPGVTENPYPWKGTYFGGIPVTYEAIPLEGYRFSHWEGVEAETRSFTINPSEAAMITAHFSPADKMDIIQLWHFNHLPANQDLSSVKADFSLGEAGVITFPGEGAGHMDRVADGSHVNIQQGVEPGYGLRVRNPSHTRELLFSTPSTGFDSLEFSFATKRTPNGAWSQTVYVSANGGESWTQAGEINVVSEDWQRIKIDLSGFPQLDDNPAMQIKILFGGDTASGESGNNRFDNIILSGRFISGIISYFNKPAGNLNEIDSWGREPDGSGQKPGSFDTPGAVYHFRNGEDATLSGNWTVSGMLSKVVLGGEEPVTFIIPPHHSYSGPISVGDNATLVIHNAFVPELKTVSPLSTVAFEQNEFVFIPARSWGSLHFRGGIKVFSGEYRVEGNFMAEDTGLSFASPTSLILKGDIDYTGSVNTKQPENVNILATGTTNQLFRAEDGNQIDAYNFYVEKTSGSLTMAADICAINNLRLDISDRALFSDGGHTLQLGDDLRIRGGQENFDLSGTVLLTASRGTNDMETTGVPLHNLIIEVDGDARVDFNLATQIIRIKNDLKIRSRSSRPIRLRDMRFEIMGNLLLDVEEPEQIEQGSSLLVFNGEKLQLLTNLGYEGPGLMHSIIVNGGGLQLEGNLTVDSSIELLKGLVFTGNKNLLKLGTGGTISHALENSYIIGPMGIYNDSRESVLLDFPVGKKNGLHRIKLNAEHLNENLRLYTAEYFDEAPPEHELGTGDIEILEEAGWYKIETDREGEMINASVILSYASDTYPSSSITIVNLRDDQWVSIGSEPLPGQQNMFRSTAAFNKIGTFAFALNSDSSVTTRFIKGVINVYPNPVPANGKVYLPDMMDVTLFSSSGIAVLSLKNVQSLDLAGLPPGVYILKNRQGWLSRILITSDW